MAQIKVKGIEISYFPVKDSFQRRMIQFENKILAELKRVGVDYNYIHDFERPKIAIAPKPAFVKWGMGHSACTLIIEKEKRYIDNLQLVLLTITSFVEQVMSGQITVTDFERKFAIEGDANENRAWACEVLGVPEDCKDMSVINLAYKKLAKAHHPDMSTGDPALFKDVNEAHKLLKRELE